MNPRVPPLCPMLIATALAGPVAVQAQQAPEAAPTEIAASGQAYLDALRLRRIDTDVVYYDPTRPPPPLDTNARIRAEAEPRDISVPGNPKLQFGLPALVVLIGLAVLVWRFGGGVTVSFGRDGGAAPIGRARAPHEGADDSLPASLSAILATPDRRAALMRLTAAALARAIDRQGLRFQKSWTGRDVLRNLPTDAPLRAELRALVYASERVHFGGHDVSDDELRTHVAQMRPLIEGRP